MVSSGLFLDKRSENKRRAGHLTTLNFLQVKINFYKICLYLATFSTLPLSLCNELVKILLNLGRAPVTPRPVCSDQRGDIVTAYSPNLLVFGSELPLDGRNHLFDGKVPSAEATDRSAYLSMIRNRQELLKAVEERMQHALAANAKYFKSRRRADNDKVGAKKEPSPVERR